MYSNGNGGYGLKQILFLKDNKLIDIANKVINDIKKENKVLNSSTLHIIKDT